MRRGSEFCIPLGKPIAINPSTILAKRAAGRVSLRTPCVPGTLVLGLKRHACSSVFASVRLYRVRGHLARVWLRSCMYRRALVRSTIHVVSFANSTFCKPVCSIVCSSRFAVCPRLVLFRDIPTACDFVFRRPILFYTCSVVQQGTLSLSFTALIQLG